MTNTKNPKIISFAAIKGGVGKTTLSYNFGEWLADKGKTVLFIDLDHQCNLSHTYDIYDNETNIGNIFTKKGKVKIHKVNDNISIIGGNLYLDDIQANIQTLPDKNMLLYMWMYDNARLGKNNIDELCVTDFDYVIIDCHPDFMTATKNALIVSDNVLSPLIPSEFGYDAQNDFNERFNDFRQEAVDYRTRESYVTAKTMFLGNLIEHNTKESQEFIDVTSKDDSVIALVPKKQLFVKTTKDKTSLSKMMKDHDLYMKQRSFFDNIDETFRVIENNLIKSV